MSPTHRISSRRLRARLAASFALSAALVSGEVSTTVAHPLTPNDAETVLGADTRSDVSSTAESRSRTLPDAVGAGPRVRQMITVSASSWSSNYAKLKAWRRTADSDWRLVRGPVKAVVGYNGWVAAEERVQSTGTTPAGSFAIPYAFGRRANPGASLQYRRVDGDDWWPYEPRDPATYNVYQFHKSRQTHWRSGKSEHLDSYTKQYGYALVVGFNLPRDISYSRDRRQWVAAERADTSRGGGIFLHVRGDGYTAGCVAMSRANMRWLVRWVRPAAHARVVMGPHDYIVRL